MFSEHSSEAVSLPATLSWLTSRSFFFSKSLVEATNKWLDDFFKMQGWFTNYRSTIVSYRHKMQSWRNSRLSYWFKLPTWKTMLATWREHETLITEVQKSWTIGHELLWITPSGYKKRPMALEVWERDFEITDWCSYSFLRLIVLLFLLLGELLPILFSTILFLNRHES